LRNADYRRLFGVTRYTAVRELRALVDDGFLRIEGERRGAHYLPLPALGLAEK
jgi:predicted HTH transcriptional regulator